MAVTTSLLIEPRLHDLGDGFNVRRMLPSALCRQIGPFVFFDHIGPAPLPPGRGLDVRPHPHIGLATVTYLYEGALTHRDSLGSEQVIRPGDVNWMTAGRGIVHSERTPDPERASGHRMHGVQTWVALPLADEEAAPEFLHYPGASLPERRCDGVRLRVIAGRSFDMESPVRVRTPTLYVDVELDSGATLVVPPEHAQRAVHVVSGDVRIGDTSLMGGCMLVVAPGDDVHVTARTDARVLLCGGAPLDGMRFLWWNFVSSNRERIERAKADWLARRFGAVPGDSEYIPLPES